MSNTTKKLKSPISALFLLKFDVRTGYTIEWSKCINDSISLKGIEFKALPSGLHQSTEDVIAFVEDQDELAFPGKLIYGISVYHSNLEDDNVDDRANVRMYSLGLLITPDDDDSLVAENETLLDSGSDDAELSRMLSKRAQLVWKPLTYTSGWEYIDELEVLLRNWLDVADDDLHKYKILEEFFQDNKQGHSGKEKQLLEMSHHYNQSHHMLLSLIPLLENFGPLIFKIWKLALLRKKMIVHNGDSIKINCSACFCISVISTIPREILPALIESGVKDIGNLQYYQPLYNVGVNDINYLETIVKNFDPGFVASTTDEILLYKPILYDYSIELASANDSLPQIATSQDFPSLSHVLKTTQRDLRRFKILYDEFDLYLKDCYLEDDLKWWLEVCEPTSWKEFIWKGFSWWATLGENDHSNYDLEINREGLDNISAFAEDEESLYTNTDTSKTVIVSKSSPSSSKDNNNNNNNNNNTINSLEIGENSNTISKEVADVLNIVGYFQNMTVKIFQVLIDILNNHDLDDSSQLLNEHSDENVVYISLSDINEMGLDPYSAQDCEFVIELVKVWWGKDAKVGTYLRNICC